MRWLFTACLIVILNGCRSIQEQSGTRQWNDPHAPAASIRTTMPSGTNEPTLAASSEDQFSIDLPPVTDVEEPETKSGSEAIQLTALEHPDPQAASMVSLSRVITSVHDSYPLVQAAFQERAIASGQRLSVWGNFDTKLKASTENGPLGFYETYRHKAGLSNPIYSGGEFFAGYRSGRGDFQPWYQERETNDGGELKAGVRVPLMRDRDIDTRRAQLWRATYDQQIADPVIRAALIAFAREASHAYWKWVAAGQKYQVGRLWLDLARDRNEKIRIRVEAQDLDPPELIDNERAIAKREAKLADSLRELQQAAVKLSLYLRDESGTPLILTPDDVPEFPRLRLADPTSVDSTIAKSLTTRPELTELNLQLRRLNVDYAEASNLTQPGLDAMLMGAQDFGAPTSSKRDKSEFEVEAGLFFDVPLQRRKGIGKMNAVQARIAQVNAKRRMVSDKISAEVRFAFAGLIQTRQEVLKAREAVRLARQIAGLERRKFELGESDLLKVVLREQYSLEAAEDEISATLRHFQAFSNYAAALAVDRPDESLLPADLPLE